MDYKTDILIIGSGITGCALSRELSGYQASVTVLEKGSDIAEGATKANSGIIHAGYDAMPGSLKAYYNVLGSSMYPSLCSQLNIPYKRCGALVIALDENESKSVEALKKRGESNGVENLSLIGKDERWLTEELKRKNYDTAKLFCVTANADGNLFVVEEQKRK